MKSTTAEKTVEKLKITFARHGLPLTVRTDNGPQFVSQVFSDYMRNIGAKHLKTTPRWPQANGEVERQNQSLLKRMKIAQAEGKDWQEEILSYLAAYRASPHPSTGYSPAELLFGRKIRTKLPQLNTEMVDNETHDQDIRDRDAEKKGLSKLYADEKRNARPSDVMPEVTFISPRQRCFCQR
jgi:transposase InsO family protein